MNLRRRIAVVSVAAGLFVASSVTVLGPVGPASAAVATAANTLSVTCLDWYDSNKKKWHVEAHVKDGLGNGVVGAKVFFENSVDTGDGTGPKVYQVSSSTTTRFGGVGKGATCGIRKSTTVTSDQCAPANSPKGLYVSRITNVLPPPGSGLVWDGLTPANGYTRS